MRRSILLLAAGALVLLSQSAMAAGQPNTQTCTVLTDDHGNVYYSNCSIPTGDYDADRDSSHNASPH